MIDPEILKIFPTARLKPYDGMPVTSSVWADAHDEHRLSRRAHDLVFHGSGIIAGLEVVANDPPNQFVYISPGIAVDPAGNVIVLNEPVAYDFGGSVDGLLYLVIGSGERETKGVEDDIVRIQNEFVIAARSTLPKRPVVELGRITIQKVGRPIKNSKDALHPKFDELDLRYRTELKGDAKKTVKVGLCSLGIVDKNVLSGWDHLKNTAEKALPYRLILDVMDDFSKEVNNFDLIYLYGKGVFKIEPEQEKLLHDYIASGRSVILEAMDNSAEISFQPTLESLKISYSPLPKGHELMNTPYLFMTVPNGASGNHMTLSNKFVYTTANFGLAWSGKFATQPVSREEIRSAHEWGINLLHYCLI